MGSASAVPGKWEFETDNHDRNNHLSACKLHTAQQRKNIVTYKQLFTLSGEHTQKSGIQTSRIKWQVFTAMKKKMSCVFLLQVLSVVKEQVSRALESQPATFDQFRNKLQHLTYAEITNIWQQERRHKEEFESQARPIV